MCRGLSCRNVSLWMVMNQSRFVRTTFLPIMPIHAIDGVAMMGTGEEDGSYYSFGEVKSKVM